jgi:UDP-3-O-[3-hydroxymyristoyl] N-acetylglucosamine deacetylase
VIQNSKPANTRDLPSRSTSKSTLGGTFEISGVGLHSGTVTRVEVMPAAAGEGRYFVRVDLPDSPQIPARVEAVGQTTLSTELAVGSASVRTVEHLLAALAGMGVDDARIEIDGGEVPLLDGSAGEWVKGIDRVGIAKSTVQQEEILNSTLNTQHSTLPISEPIWVYRGDAFVAALPSPVLQFTYGIEFDLPAIGKQWHSFTPTSEDFAEEIAPARTFGLADQVESLRAAGLIKGGSLENALVCDAKGWLNPPLRFVNEPARHKLLDLIGDISLLGTFPQAHFLAYKASHNLHIQLAQRLKRRG